MFVVGWLVKHGLIGLAPAGTSVLEEAWVEQKASFRSWLADQSSRACTLDLGVRLQTLCYSRSLRHVLSQKNVRTFIIWSVWVYFVEGAWVEVSWPFVLLCCVRLCCVSGVVLCVGCYAVCRVLCSVSGVVPCVGCCAVCLRCSAVLAAVCGRFAYLGCLGISQVSRGYIKSCGCWRSVLFFMAFHSLACPSLSTSQSMLSNAWNSLVHSTLIFKVIYSSHRSLLALR